MTYEPVHRMRRRTPGAGRTPLGSCLLAAVVAVTMAPASLSAASGDPLAEAAEAVRDGELEEGIAALLFLFASGYPTPAAVLSDARFIPLREDGASRAAWRELMADHVRESRIRMVPAAEPGTPMIIRGKVVRSPDGAPIAHAVLELNHTDATGHYEPGRTAGGDGRARLFGFVRSDADGTFEVATIKPAPYPGAGEGAAHVHFRIRAEGYRSYVQDFRPYDHPRDAADRATAVQRAERATTVRMEGETLICDLVIPMVPSGK